METFTTATLVEIGKFIANNGLGVFFAIYILRWSAKRVDREIATLREMQNRELDRVASEKNDLQDRLLKYHDQLLLSSQKDPKKKT